MKKKITAQKARIDSAENPFLKVMFLTKARFTKKTSLRCVNFDENYLVFLCVFFHVVQSSYCFLSLQQRFQQTLTNLEQQLKEAGNVDH